MLGGTPAARDRPQRREDRIIYRHVEAPVICKRSNCSNEVTPNRMGPKRVYCCPACRKADVAMRERTRRGDEGRAAHAEANRRYRARLKAAQEAERARLLQERIARINAKAREAA